MPLRMICSRPRTGRTGTFNHPFFWIPIVLVVGRILSSAGVLSFLIPLRNGPKGNLEAKKGKKKHITTSFVALSPCKHVQKRRVNVVKHQTKPDQTIPQNPPANRAQPQFISHINRGVCFFFWKNICSFLSISLSRSEIHDRLPGLFGRAKLIGKFNYSTGN